MQITINTAEGISELDRATLLALLEINAPAGPIKAAPAKKAESAKVAEKVLASKDVNPDADFQAAAEDENGEAPSLEDAIAAATELVSNGGAAKVKAALAAVGAKKVSELAGADVQSFLDALND